MRELLRAAEKYDMLPEGASVLAAVSGGADSMCLLVLLSELAEAGDIRLSAAHFDHRLRGAESDRDARFVRDFCESAGIPFYPGSGDVAAFAAQRGLGTEEAARLLRYEFLESAADAAGADLIATAHNADDNAETMLMNLARGAGLRGAAGIPPRRGRIIRPLLLASRAEIDGFLAERGIPHVEDSTNQEDVYTRNRLRHGVVPALRGINPRFSENMSETAALLRADEDYLSSLAAEFLSSARRDAFGISVDAGGLLKLPAPVAARAVRDAAEELGAPASRTLTDGVFSLAGSAAGSESRSFAGGLTVLREYGRLTFTRADTRAEGFAPVELKEGESADVPELGLRFSWLSGPQEKKIYKYVDTFLFKKGRACGNITIRPRAAGDRIAVAGGTKTLQRLFIDKKLPKRLRGLVPVLADGEGVAAVMGAGVNAARRPVKGEKTVLITVEKIGER